MAATTIAQQTLTQSLASSSPFPSASTPTSRSVSFSAASSLLGATKSLSASCIKSSSVRVSSRVVVRAAVEEAEKAAESAEAEEFYEVELEKPFGMRYYKGQDGGTYVDIITPGSGAEKGGVREGDKIVATSAIFGNEMWPAAEYGRTMYTIKNRIGTTLFRFKKMNGEREPVYTDDAVSQKVAGVVGDKVRERQVENYLKKQELKKQREEELEEGLVLYKKGEFQEALIRFETIISLQPSKMESSIALYNIACCCSKLGQVGEGLRALEDSIREGFEDFKKIREDPDLSALRNTDEFDELIEKYDESSFINEGALKALTNVFGLFGKK